jgi:hypothetical protein
MRHGWRIILKKILAKENLHLTVGRLRRCARPLERIRVLEDSRAGAMWLSGASECERSETRGPTGLQGPSAGGLVRRSRKNILRASSSALLKLNTRILRRLFPMLARQTTFVASSVILRVAWQYKRGN